MKILYAGDSEAGGSANYLLGILQSLRAEVVHIPPSQKLSPSLFKKRFDAILLSDFPRKQTPASSEQAILDQAAEGSGFLMIGGWGSFSGPFGGWRGSLIEKLLPVTCLNRDDRIHLPGGAWILKGDSPPKRGQSPALFQSLDFKNPPVICGLNQIRPKKNGLVLLSAKRLQDRKNFPLLVIDRNPARRIATLATDLAPHWSGGLLDWGKKRIKLPVRKGIQIEVGDFYVRFVTNLIKWLCSGDLEPRYATEELEGLDRLHEEEKKKGWIRFRTAKDVDNLFK